MSYFIIMMSFGLSFWDLQPWKWTTEINHKVNTVKPFLYVAFHAEDNYRTIFTLKNIWALFQTSAIGLQRIVQHSLMEVNA